MDFVDYVTIRHSHNFPSLDSIPVNNSSKTLIDLGLTKGCVLFCFEKWLSEQIKTEENGHKIPIPL